MRHQPSNTNDLPCSDALWEAVQYLSGELSPEQAAMYESRLGDDVAAAEALAEAVSLTESLVQCRDAAPLARPAAMATPFARRRGVRVALSVLCASGLVLVGWYLGSQSGSQPSSPAASALAVVDGESNDADSTLSVWVALNDATEVATDDSLSETSAVDAADVPDWMFAAVLASAEDSDDSHDADGLLRGLDTLDEESL